MTAPVTEKLPDLPDLADDAWYEAEPPDDAGAPEPPSGAPAADSEAPYGWTTGADGKRRPKLKPGRPKVQKTAEELAAGDPAPRVPDEPPKTPPRTRRTTGPGGGRGAAKTTTDAPQMPKGGVIAQGVDRLYRRAGKVIRGLEHGDEMGVGQALIECTRPDPEDPDAITVGQAWENLCRDNPRVRAWVLRMIAGGAWQEIIMAHAPLGVALIMKPWVKKMIPFSSLMESWLEADEDTTDEDLTPGDVKQMADTTADTARRAAVKMAARQARAAGLDPAKVIAEAERMAASGHVPAGFGGGGPRTQPKTSSRASRRKAR